MTGTGGDDPAAEPVGGLGEEAAKLLHALQDWAKESGTDLTGGAGATGGPGAGALHQINEHVATGDPECRYCPVCQVISVVRGTSPEVRQHLASAAASLMQALAGALATEVPESESKSPRGGGVEKISLDDTEWEDD